MPDCSYCPSESCAAVMFDSGGSEELCLGCLQQHRPELDLLCQHNVIMLREPWTSSAPPERITIRVSDEDIRRQVRGEACPACAGPPVSQFPMRIAGDLWAMQNQCARGHHWSARMHSHRYLSQLPGDRGEICNCLLCGSQDDEEEDT